MRTLGTGALEAAPGNVAHYTDEQAQDAAAAMIAAGTATGITFTYNDAANSLSATVTGGAGTAALGTATPIVDGTGAAGTSSVASHDDHVHPTDTSRAALVSPIFTGTPVLPTGTTGTTQTAGNNSTKLATTAYTDAADALKANLASPTFTGSPALPTGTTGVTQTAGDSTTKLATTAFVTTADNLKANIASPTFTGTPSLPTGTTGVTQTAGDNTTKLATTAFVQAAGGGYSDEKAQDAAAAMFAAGTASGITFTYNDAANSMSATVSAGSSALITDWENVLWHGAVGDGSTDCTTAFNAAGSAAAAKVQGSSPAKSAVYVPAGAYMVHELNWPNNVLLVGTGGADTKLRYNGAGGTASYVISMSSADAFGGSGIRDIAISGHSLANATDPPAQNVIQLPSTSSDSDWGFELTGVRISNSFSDGILIGNGQIINLHFNRFRADGIGGFVISATGAGGSLRGSFTITDSTICTVIQSDDLSTFGSAVVSLGYGDGTNWCKGILYLSQQTDLNVHISDGRWEITKPVVFDNRKQLIYIKDLSPKVVLESIQVTGSQSTPFILVRDKAGQADIFLENCTAGDWCKYIETARNTPEWDVGSYRHYRSPMIAVWGGAAGSNGIYLNGTQIEVRDSIPTAIDRDYKRGDVCHNRAAAVGSPVGWVVTAPTTGWGNPTVPTLSTTSVVTSGSQTVTVAAADLWRMPVGAAITLVGAGAGGVDLNTVVDDIDYAASTIHVTNNPGTSKNPATIKQQGVTWTAMANL